MSYRPYLALPALVGALLGGTVVAHAQVAQSGSVYPAAASPAPHHGRNNRMARVLRGLNLSSDQRSRITTLMRTYRQSRSSAHPETRRELMAQIDGVLTPAQRTQFASAMQHRRGNGSEREAAPSVTPAP